MKQILPLTAAALSLLAAVSCKQECTINGTANGPLFTDEGHYVALLDVNYKQIDSCKVKDGTFSFTRPLNEKDMLTLIAVTPEEGLDESSAIVIIPDSKSITVDMDKSEVSGSPLSEEWTAFQHSLMDKWTEVQAEAVKLMESGDKDGAVAAYSAMESWIQDNAKSLVEKHLDDPVGIQALSMFASMSPVEETIALYDKCGELIKGNLLLSEFIESLRKQSEAKAGGNYILKNSADGTLTKVEGNLDTYLGQGKYVLVDFWASWCGPCREESPNVIAVYNDYKDKGLVVVGVTVGDDPEDSKKAVAELGIPYDQVVDADGSLFQKYGIQSIPRITLFDPDGNIAADNLRGENIEAAVKNVLK